MFFFFGGGLVACGLCFCLCARLLFFVGQRQRMCDCFFLPWSELGSLWSFAGVGTLLAGGFAAILMYCPGIGELIDMLCKEPSGSSFNQVGELGATLLEYPLNGCLKKKKTI